MGLFSCTSSWVGSGTVPATHISESDVGTASSDGSVGEPVALGCADAGSPGPASDTDLTVDGLTFSGVAANGRTTPGSIMLTGSSGSYVFRKVFLYVAQGAAAITTLEIVAPGNGRLYYVSGDRWMTRRSADEVIAGATRRVAVASCRNPLTGYFGGVLTAHGECATIAVTTHDGGDRRVVNIPVSGGTC